MAMIDTYRNTLSRRKEELAKLNSDYAKEKAKFSPQQRKINSAKAALGRTKNESTIKSKYREIERAEGEIVKIQKNCSNIQNKIVRKEKEVITAEKNYRNEEIKENKKREEAEKKRVREANRQTDLMKATLNQHTQEHMQMREEIEQLKALPEKITILFLAANPSDAGRLSLDEEARLIHEKIRMSEYHDSLRFESRWAVRSSDILQAVNETDPTIVHFSGHGSTDGDLLLLNPDGTYKLVSKEKITAAMGTVSDTLKLVVFNTCFSEAQAENVVNHIDSAIGMSDSIGDEAARVFAAQLYSSIGFGLSLEKSFDQAIVQLMLEDIPEEKTPKLYIKEGVEKSQVIFVDPKK